jgi:uncharacterized metal-binding protein YceD (DUF177 family)
MTALEWTHAARDVPADGLAISRQATSEEARALAETLEIPAVDSLDVTYRLAPIAGGRFSLKGRLEARITQECVVTLEPVLSAVSLPLDVVFSPEASVPGNDLEGSLEDLEQPDEEPIEHGVIDVGRVVTEEILSGLDPYPRREDARFDWSDEKGEGASVHPFAALARLKKTGDSA